MKQRDCWVNLCGTWEFAFDDTNRGFQLGWTTGKRFDLSIVVPFPYQSEASGINDKGIHEVVWYARSFEFLEEWVGLDLLIHFGAVDYSCTVWINGIEVGSNRGGNVPLSFEISAYCNIGENRVTLRVEDRIDAFQPRGKQSTTGLPFGIDYYCTTGIWQPVWLEPVSPVRIDELKVTPLIEQRAFELRVLLHAPGAPWRVEAEVLDDQKQCVLKTIDIQSAGARMFIPIPNAELWSPEHPKLYDLIVRLYRDGILLDEVRSYVGLRQIEIRNGITCLNGNPVYMRMVLDQGYWPESYLAAPSDDAMREDVEWAKRYGFNGVRKHQKVEDPRWLYWCDRLGMMVWGEMANARSWSTASDEMLAAEWIRAVERDYNHPCIVAWVPLNESMGYPELQAGHPSQYAFVENIVRITRRLDSSRLVIDNDGWEHTDVSDIIAIHDYSEDSEKLAKRYQDTLARGNLPTSTWLEGKRLFIRGSRHWGQPVMLTEIGGYLYRPPEIHADKLDMLYGNYGSIGSFEELLDKYRDLMEGVRMLTFVSGFCYTQLTDVEQERNGLLTYDRKPKVPPEEIARINDQFQVTSEFPLPIKLQTQASRI